MNIDQIKDMEYLFEEEHLLFHKNVSEFAQTELAPGYLKRAQIHGFDKEILKKIADFGVFGFRIPEKYGGQGDAMDFRALGIACEELGRADYNVTSTLPLTANAAQIVLNYAQPSLVEEVLPKFVAGDLLVGVALTEAHCGCDAAAIKTTAVKDGDYYVLNGEKSANSFVDAPYHIVYTKTDPAAGHKGVSAFLVHVDDSPTIVKSVFGDIGMKPLKRGAITFKNHRIPKETLLHEEGKGFRMALVGEDASRPLMVLQCLGCAQAALDDAIAYSKQRTAFGKPIAAYQGVSFPIAEAATYIEACKLLCYKALWKCDHGIEFTKEANMVKWWGPKLAFQTIKECLIIHGHFGYCDEYTLAQRMVDVMGFEIGGGTEQLNKLLVAQSLIGREVRM